MKIDDRWSIENDRPKMWMRPMWHTGSPYGAEILKLAVQVRG